MISKFVIRKDGFTLIELLVVIAIVGLLATLTLIRFRDTQARARDTRRVVDINTLIKIFHLYNNRIGEYPYPYADVVMDGGDAVSTKLKNESVLRASIVDPSNIAPYEYIYTSAAGDTFEIKYSLETDSIPGRNQGVNYASP